MLKLFSPAKINLFLRVVSKRPDGYHNLSSVFQTISLGDTLTFALSAEDRLTCSDPDLPVDKSNLVIKAVNLFRAKTGCLQCFDIHLHKRIPMQAGLGGGSSNAATTLWACRQLTQLAIDTPTLAAWGAEIGSDVPFFLSHGTAYCSGRGEIVQPLSPLKNVPTWIVKPEGGLSTPAVYQKLHVSGFQKDHRDLEDFLAGSLPLFNDLEPPAFQIRPDLQALKTHLFADGFQVVLMSGSGSSFFCQGLPKLLLDKNLAIFPVNYLHRSTHNWFEE